MAMEVIVTVFVGVDDVVPPPIEPGYVAFIDIDKEIGVLGY